MRTGRNDKNKTIFIVFNGLYWLQDYIERVKSPKTRYNQIKPMMTTKYLHNYIISCQ